MAKKYKNQIGWVNNKDIPRLRNVPGGHYVYVRDYDKSTGKCSFNTITSLEDYSFNIKNNRVYEMKRGNIYPIPKKDCNFPLWSGISTNPITNIDVSKINFNINKKIKKRHRFFINKYLGVKRY